LSRPAWDQSQGYGIPSIIIAIIDTGVDTAHPDLRLVPGYDYGDNDSNPMDNSADPGHGTACSGVAAGIANNALGVTGVAGGCSVMPLKIADSAGSLGFTAIENALTHCGNNGVHIASMSFGAEGGTGEGDSPSTDTALEYAYSHGVTLLAATANSNASTIAYPSNHNKVIAIGAASPTGQRKSPSSSDGETWWGSNYGVGTQDNQNTVDVMAPTILPATDITGTGGYDSGNYSMWFNGTSCATPYAAGVAGLIKSKDPSLTPAQVRTAMVSTATDMTIDGGAGWDIYTGYGMVNANNALLSLIPGMPSCAITSPAGGSVLDLNSTVNVAVTATDTDGSIVGVQFYVNDVLQYTDNTSPYTWNWNTTGFSAGNHTIKAVATDNSANTAQSQITITLLAPPDEGFETGNFSAYGWVNTSGSPWLVQSVDKYSGTYAAQSGDISDNGITDLSISLNVTGNGNISFFQKVSSESGYDYLRFFIDGVQQAQWAGSGAWTQQSYPVTAGAHTFLWRYMKDGSVSSGSDCAWIDHIVFPPVGAYYAPPQNLTASPSHQSVKLDWAAPASGTPTGYKIFKNSSLLTTVTGLTYTDTAVTNGTSYSYYLKAVYSGGNESDATSTVNATPNAIAPTNLTATAGNGFVDLSWTGTTGREAVEEFGTSDRAISGYRIYRNSSLLTTLAGTSYTDNAVVNESTYSYYVTTVYASPAGESGPSNTVNAMPTAVVPSEAIIGSGTSTTGTTTASPINVYYESLHGQAVYTAAELNAAGVFGPINITQIGFNVFNLPTLAMPNFIVRMGHTTAANVADWISTGLTQLLSIPSYQPGTTGWNMLTLSIPFEWNGTDNLLVDTAFGDIGSYTSTGTVQYTSVTSGYRYVRLDTADQTDVFTGGYTSTYRPNLKLILQPIASGPAISVNPANLNFGDVAVGSSATQQFTIQNIGTDLLSGTITTPTGFNVSVSGRNNGFTAYRSESRNTISFSINPGQSGTWDLAFVPSSASTYGGNVVISSNATNNPTVSIAVSGAGYIPPIISVSTDQLTANLYPDETDTQGFTIGNSGSQTLNYGFELTELRHRGRSLRTAGDRNITGSTLVLDALDYTPGTTLDWTFTVTNASTDDEWLKDVYITFPTGVTVNSATNFVGGSNGDMTPDITSGNGITIHWNGVSGGWGVVIGGESASATVNLSISGTFGGNLVLPFQIDGDIYGAEPHVLTGEITLVSLWTPLDWFDVSPVSGSVAPGGSVPITAYFDSAALTPGQYLATLNVNSNDPVNPQMTIDVTLNVQDPNQPPVIIPPDVFSFAKNDVLVVDFTPYVSDPDSDPLSLSYSGNTNIQVTIDGLSVTFNSLDGWVGSENITFTVSDGYLEASAVVNVSSNNTPPTLNLPDSWSFSHRGYIELDFSHYVSDADGDELSISYSGNSILEIQHYVYQVIIMSPFALVCTESITFTVDDGINQASDTVLVSATNAAPWVDLPDNWSFNRNGSLQVDLDPISGDADGDEIEVTWSMTEHISVVENDLIVTFSAPGGWVGSESITFTVIDGIDQTSDTVLITVTNTAPWVDLPEGWSFARNGSLDVNLEPYGGDDDGDGLEVTWSITQHIQMELNGLMATFSAPDGWVGSESITFTVDDGIDQASDTVEITVTNSAPWITMPASLSFTRHGSLDLYMTDYSGDIDNDDLEITWTGNDNILIELDTSGRNYVNGSNRTHGAVVTLSAPGGWAGTETVTFTVDDGYAQNSDTVEITVTNSAPTIDLPYGWFMPENTVASRDLSEFAGDPDFDSLEYSFAGNTHIALSFDGSTLTATPEAGWYGFETVTITVSDGYLQASDTWDIVVEHVVNSLDTPVVTISMAGANLLLDWQPVPNATSYHIYACDDPYGVYELYATSPTNHFETTIAAGKAFYKVIAVYDPPLK